MTEKKHRRLVQEAVERFREMSRRCRPRTLLDIELEYNRQLMNRMFQREDAAMAVGPGQVIDHGVFKTGDVVEYLPTKRYGIITQVATSDLRVAEFGTGELLWWLKFHCKLRHGYLHVDREDRQVY